MTVLVSRRAPASPALDSRRIASLARRMLRSLELDDSELSILLTDDGFIRSLNRDHRGKDKPTDVLSFPQSEFLRPLVPRKGHDLAVLGDVIISLDTAERQANSRQRSLVEEVRFLLAHGLLHLLGFDHANPAEKAEMTRQTRALVRAVSEG